VFLVLNPLWRCDLAEEAGRCPYCPNEVSEDGRRVKFYWGLGENVVEKQATANDWLAFISKIGRTHVDICGGEPLAWDELPELVAGFPGGCKWSMTSNCLNLEALQRLDFSACTQVTASFHPYTVGKIGYLDKFFGSLRYLASKKVWVVVSVMAFPGNIQWLMFYLEAFQGWGYDVIPQPYEDPRYDWREHPDKLAALEAFGKKFCTSKLPYWGNKTAGGMCEAGHNYLVASPGGSVYRCNLALVSGFAPLGSIYDGSNFILKEPTLCEQVCSSSCDRERRGRGLEMVGAT